MSRLTATAALSTAAALAASAGTPATANEEATEAATKDLTPEAPKLPPLAYEQEILRPFRVSYIAMRPGSSFTEEYFLVIINVAMPGDHGKNEGEIAWSVPRTQTAKFLADRLIGHVKLHGPAATFKEIVDRLQIRGEPTAVLLGEDYASRQARRANFATGSVTGETRRPAGARAPTAARNAALDAAYGD